MATTYSSSMDTRRLIAIGDIHGCYHTLQSLLTKVGYASATDTLVCIGDYIDRGPYSFETVDFLIKLQEQAGADKVVCLKGNHEAMAVGDDDDLWMFNGGMHTLVSYDKNSTDISAHTEWMQSLPLLYETPEMIFCHAGLSKAELEDNTEDDLLWGRDWILQDIPTPQGKQVVFGHTPGTQVYLTANGSICIDTGCVSGNMLTALVLSAHGGEIVQVRKHIRDCREA